jgi:hypothetical protein
MRGRFRTDSDYESGGREFESPGALASKINDLAGSMATLATVIGDRYRMPGVSAHRPLQACGARGAVRRRRRDARRAARAAAIDPRGEGLRRARRDFAALCRADDLVERPGPVAPQGHGHAGGAAQDQPTHHRIARDRALV